MRGALPGYFRDKKPRISQGKLHIGGASPPKFARILADSSPKAANFGRLATSTMLAAFGAMLPRIEPCRIAHRSAFHLNTASARTVAVLACVRPREQTGHGYAIDMGLLDCAVAAQVNVAQA